MHEIQRVTAWLNPNEATEKTCVCGREYKSKYGNITNCEWLKKEAERIGDCRICENESGRVALYKRKP